MEDKVSYLIPGFTLLARYRYGPACEVWFARDIHNVPRMIRLVPKTNNSSFCPEDRRIIFYRLFSEECPHLLHLLYVGETNECFYYVSQSIDNVWDHQNIFIPYFEADTLLRRLKLAPVSRLEIIRYVLDIIEGLKHLHDHGMTHNALIPENIVFVHNVLKLTDPVMNRTRWRELPPAQELPRAGNEMEEERCDIYALGEIICALICNSGDPGDIYEVLHGKVKRDLRPFQKIAMRCCADNPAERYRNCRQIQLDVLKMVKKRNPHVRLLCFLLTLFSVQSVLLGLSLSCTITLYRKHIRIRQYSQTSMQNPETPCGRKGQRRINDPFAILPVSHSKRNIYQKE